MRFDAVVSLLINRPARLRARSGITLVELANAGAATSVTATAGISEGSPPQQFSVRKPSRARTRSKSAE
ncbi:MAG TPA: hypothetical protein VMK66_10560 [Myxococcales bacterium]|nr:hypothetical protein [Myxococcales bacterium]